MQMLAVLLDPATAASAASTPADPHMLILAVTMGWIIAVVIGLLALAIVWFIFTGKINLSELVSEPKGGASLSRFQFLIFTFVIAMSLFLDVVRSNADQFPDIHGGILALLGISGGSYVISKGIQTSRDVKLGEQDKSKPATVAGTPTPGPTPPPAQSV